uniref:ARAD1C01716p n=1 Tax=Blastobotrys adeninivorans TaxID=409370 RepID=A0A060SZ16_BLAAD
MTNARARLSVLTRHLTTSALSPEPVHIHQLNPTFFLPKAAEIEPNALAEVHKSRTNTDVRFTYRQFSARVVALAHYFKHHGYKRIAILGPNTPAHLETMFAATAAGGIVLGLNYRLSKTEITYKMDLGKADCVVVDSEFENLITPDSKRHVIVDLDDFSDATGANCQYAQAIKEGFEIAKQQLGFYPGEKHRNAHEDWVALHAENVEEDSLLGLFFTSGTTGKPKGVEYTHRGVYLAALSNVIEAGLNRQAAFGGHGRCKYLWTLPLFHAAGWTYPYSVTAVRGTHYLLRKVDVDRIWDLLIHEGITHFNAAPTVNTMLLNSEKAQKLPQEVHVIVAAAPPSSQLFHDMVAHNLYPVHMYGLTETYGPFTRSYFKEEWKDLPHHDMVDKLAHQGHAFLTSAKARVVRPDFTDVASDGKEMGEIIVRGNIVAKGYHNNPTATKESFDGWFKTGDLAVMHPNGAIQIQDRKKDIIISGGENISSVFVEGELSRHEAILECAVVGKPDKHYGEVPVAFVVLRRGYKEGTNFNTNDLVEWLKQQIGRYQVPRTVKVLDALPKTSTGKLRKNVLRDQLKEEAKSEGSG